MPDEAAWNELKSLQDSLLKIWQMYVAWFTWSLGLNLLAISYITTRETIRPDFITGLSLIMALALLLSVGAGLVMRQYHLATLARAERLAFGDPRSKPDVGLIMGNRIAHYACWTVPAIHIAVLGGWLAIVARYGALVF